MTEAVMDLDDILGELSNLEEQLDLQQEEFARTTTKHSQCGATSRNTSLIHSPDVSNRNRSADFGVILGGDFNLLNNTALDNSTDTAFSKRSSSVRTTNGILKNNSRSQDYLSRPDFNLAVDINYNGDSLPRDSSTRTSHTLPRNASLRVASPGSRASCDVPSSCSSSRNSSQSFGSDWNEAAVMQYGNGCHGNGFHGNGSSTLQSTVSLSSQNSSSSGSTSPRKSLPMTCVKIHSPDGTCKTVAADTNSTVSEICQVLIKKNSVAPSPSWCILEQVRELYMERILEDHIKITEVLDCWVKDSPNRLLFAEVTQKYDMFNNQILFENDAYTPDLEGSLYIKLEGKKQWKRIYCVLRASGIYYSSKGKGKITPSDLTCLQTLSNVELFTAVSWKKIHKSPTEFGFALKTGMIQKAAPKYIKYLCADDQESLWRWITGIRLCKYGKKLQDNYQRAKLSFGACIGRSSTTLGHATSSATGPLNTSSSPIGPTSQPIAGRFRAGSIGSDDESSKNINKNCGSAGERKSEEGSFGGYNLRQSVREGRSGTERSDKIGQHHDTNIGAVNSMTMPRKSGNIKNFEQSGINSNTRSIREPSYNGIGVNDSTVDHHGSGSDARTKQQHYGSVRSTRSDLLKEQHGRSSSTDRLLDGVESYGTVRRPNRNRSGSVDRLLDGGNDQSVDMDEDGWDDFDSGTIRRSARYSNGTLGSRPGSFRRCSNATTPNKMVANIPITTNVTRQMSQQQDVRTLSRSKKSRQEEEYDDVDETMTRTPSSRTLEYQRHGSQGSFGASARIDSLLAKAAARPVSNASSVSLRWSGSQGDMLAEKVAQAGGSDVMAGRDDKGKYGPMGDLSKVSGGSVAGLIRQEGELRHGVSLDDLPPPPMPMEVNTQPSAVFLPLPKIPSSPLLEDQLRSSTGSAPRPRPASPNVLPPPPPDFLLAFPPSQAWAGPPPVKLNTSFEENLDEQLEFLEQQVSQLSPGGTRSRESTSGESRSCETRSSEIRSSEIRSDQGSSGTDCNIKLNDSNNGTSRKSSSSGSEQYEQVMNTEQCRRTSIQSNTSNPTLGRKASTGSSQHDYACPTDIINSTREQIYTSLNTSPSGAKDSAYSEKFYADGYSSRSDFHEETMCGSRNSIASSGYSSYKSRDAVDHGYASIEDSIQSSAHAMISMQHTGVASSSSSQAKPSVYDRTSGSHSSTSAHDRANTGQSGSSSAYESMIPSSVHTSIPPAVSKTKPPIYDRATLSHTNSNELSQKSPAVNNTGSPQRLPLNLPKNRTPQREIATPPMVSPIGSPTSPDVSFKVSASGSIRRPNPPAPPKRAESTMLTSKADGSLPPQTGYFLRDLDRVISQKHEQGAGGMVNLEMPLPPPPPLILEDESVVNFSDLPPPPPADMLLGLRTLRKKIPPTPPRAPPKPNVR